MNSNADRNGSSRFTKNQQEAFYFTTWSLRRRCHHHMTSDLEDDAPASFLENFYRIFTGEVRRTGHTVKQTINAEDDEYSDFFAPSRPHFEYK
jgi:hypothetical protein